MEKCSPKIEIINHFDNLINRIDIDIDSSLEKFNDQQLLSEILTISEKDRRDFNSIYVDFTIKLFDTIDSPKQNLDSWPESTKVVDYLKEVRMKTIEELRTAQEDTLEYYKLNSDRFKSELTNEKNIVELKSELFSEKFYFQVNLKQSEKRFWAFDVFTFVTNFYMCPSDIDSLEKLINSEKEPLGRTLVFDDKIVLTGLLYKFFIMNLLNFPNHVIHVRKQDVLNIESIDYYHKYSGVNLTSPSTIDLSKLVDLSIDLTDRLRAYSIEPKKFKIDGLPFLKKLFLGANTDKIDFSIKNLPSLTTLHFYIYGTIDENILTKLLDQVMHIKELYLDGNLSHFNLDSLVNLRKLSLDGTIDKNFNFELFKNLCNQLEDINIFLNKIDQTTFFKLFGLRSFTCLVKFSIRAFYIDRLKKEFIIGFPMLRQLIIIDCNIKEIGNDSFPNLKQLCILDLSYNLIDYIERNAFSKLINLEEVNVNNNNLRYFDPKFVGLRESAKFSIENNNYLKFKFFEATKSDNYNNL